MAFSPTPVPPMPHLQHLLHALAQRGSFCLALAAPCPPGSPSPKPQTPVAASALSGLGPQVASFQSQLSGSPRAGRAGRVSGL